MFLDIFSSQKEWQNFIKVYRDHKPAGKTKRGKTGIRLELLADENIWPFIISAVYRQIKAPMLVMTQSSEKADEISKDIDCIAPGINKIRFPYIPLSDLVRANTSNIDSLAKRLELVNRLTSDEKDKGDMLLISPITSLISLIDEDSLNKNKKKILYKDNQYERDELVRDFSSMGYERVHKVYDKGEYSVRGSNIDIFDIRMEQPIRLLFTEDVLEKIYSFEVAEQESIRQYEKIDFFANKNIWEPKKGARYVSLIDLFERHFGSGSVVVLEPVELAIKLRSEIDIFEKSMSGKDTEGYLLDKDLLNNKRFDLRLDISSLDRGINKSDVFEFKDIKGQKQSFSNPERLISNLRSDLSSKKKAMVFIEDNNRLKNISQLLGDNSISYRKACSFDESPFNDGVIDLYKKELYRGFSSSSLSLYGQLDVYDYVISDRLKEKAPPKVVGFEPGEYVVHKVHGIGKYAGIVSRQIDGLKGNIFYRICWQ
jgi:transcription-repair coupling factor (superfamily II helicase)